MAGEVDRTTDYQTLKPQRVSRFQLFHGTIHSGARLGDPGRFIGRQQGEHRWPPVRLDPHGPAGGLQQVDDGRLARQGREPGLRGAEPVRVGLGVVRHQQGRRRAAPAPHRPGDSLADGRDPPRLRQGARRIGQGLPLVRGLGENPGVQVDQDPSRRRVSTAAGTSPDQPSERY